MNKLLLCCAVATSFAACAVAPAPTVDETTSSPVVSTPAPATAAPVATAVTCDEIWDCDQICGTFINGHLVRYGTNVLHRLCSDGSDTVVHRDPCGEACF
jgi:hypothetical protein